MRSEAPLLLLPSAPPPVSEQTLDAPPIEVPDGPPRERRRAAPMSTGASLAYRYRWVLTAAALLLVSLAIVLYARTRPGYDPYGWLVWGKLTLHLKLDTNGAPSWKPLPYLFTVPYALFGHYALWLWMVTSVAISLSGLIFAWRIAFRLTYSRPERRYASYVAGLFAAAFVLAMQDPVGNYNYTHYILSAESDTMIVSLCLLAIDLHLSGPPQGGVLDLVACIPRAARGVAVLRARRRVALVEATELPLVAVRLPVRARLPVVRDSRA